MLTNEIAKVYQPGAFHRMSLGPGEYLEFRGGVASVENAVYMPKVLAIPGVQVEINAEYAEWISGWVEAIPIGAHPSAVIVLTGEGREQYSVGPAPDYVLTRTETPLEPQAPYKSPEGWKRPVARPSKIGV